MTELEGFAAYVECVFESVLWRFEASVKYSASCDLDRSEHNSRFNSVDFWGTHPIVSHVYGHPEPDADGVS